MKIKTVELTGAALDWAVAESLGHTPVYNMKSHGMVWRGWWERTPKTPTGEYRRLESYSTDWSLGGPILVEDMIMYSYAFGLFWTWLHDDPEGDRNPRASGPTLLVAIARCRVASKLGDEVDIPEELLQ